MVQIGQDTLFNVNFLDATLRVEAVDQHLLERVLLPLLGPRVAALLHALVLELNLEDVAVCALADVGAPREVFPIEASVLGLIGLRLLLLVLFNLLLGQRQGSVVNFKIVFLRRIDDGHLYVFRHLEVAAVQRGPPLRRPVQLELLSAGHRLRRQRSRLREIADLPARKLIESYAIDAQVSVVQIVSADVSRSNGSLSLCKERRSAHSTELGWAHVVRATAADVVGEGVRRAFCRVIV